MNSKIAATLDRFLPEDGTVATSQVYTDLKKDLGYFERFVTAPGMPDVVGIIDGLIDYRTQPMQDPRLSIHRLPIGRHVIAITNSAEMKGEVVLVGDVGVGDNTIGLKSGDYGPRRLDGPAVYIDRFGYNRTDRDDLREKGVLIQAYKLPKSPAKSLLKSFRKVESRDRNEVLLHSARARDKIECTPGGWEQFHWEQIERFGSVDDGIDEGGVYVFKRRYSDVCVYARAYGFKQTDGLSLTMRIERPGTAFSLPTKQYD